MKTEYTEWFNGTRKSVGEPFVWPNLKGNLQFCYSQSQSEITITHKDDKRLGITFTSELVKRFDAHDELLNLVLGAHYSAAYAAQELRKCGNNEEAVSQEEFAIRCIETYKKLTQA